MQSAALSCIAEYGVRAERELVTEDLIESLAATQGSDGAGVRARLAEAIGALRARLANLGAACAGASGQPGG